MTRTRILSLSVLRLAFAVVVACLVASQGNRAQAASLGLVQQQPDLFASFLNTDYVLTGPNTGQLTVEGDASTWYANQYTIDAPQSFNMSIAITFDGNGVPTDADGTLTILGKIPAYGANSGTLVTGSLSSAAQLGFLDPPGGENFEFLFDVDGGDLAPDYDGVVNGLAGVKLEASSTGFTGRFDVPFSNNSSFDGVADVFPVPEPSALLLFAAGGLVFVWCARMRTTLRL